MMQSSMKQVLLIWIVCTFQFATSFTSSPLHQLVPSRQFKDFQALLAVSVPQEETNNGDRFDRVASEQAKVDEPCIMSIDGKMYDLSAWAKAHPGGVKVLEKFHGKDASRAFEAAGHSAAARKMLAQFEIKSTDVVTTMQDETDIAELDIRQSRRPRWVNKLFTKEDPLGIHKYCGIFVLVHYAVRISQMYFFDISAGYGSRGGKGPGIIAPLCLIPHAVLSLSALIFHTVPKERVVGKPMIWQEYRVHNIAFGIRSVLATFFGWLSVYKGHSPFWRKLAVYGCVASCLSAMIIADEGTKRLRADVTESTTATMPYWEGCSKETQKRFKNFYAYCQFMATLGCLACTNPAYGLSILFPIQIASFFMTLVRKGISTAGGYHLAYTLGLIMPYYVLFRSVGLFNFVQFTGLAAALYQLRRKGVNKYALWLPLFALRVTIGDKILSFKHF